ncbi:HAD family hydrolase [Modicisalibacter zincidurans]|uniref:HAD family hydrolase n=1 Tax=Modicisalibacter zincidurans TaxID=1178777 RepID=UPI000A4C218F
MTRWSASTRRSRRAWPPNSRRWSAWRRRSRHSTFPNSSRRRVVASLASTGLDAQLGEAPLFTAEQVARPKPAPDIYLLAAESLGVVPEACLAVEDSVSGANAARAAGMTVIGFTGASHIEPGHDARLREAGVWQVLERMAELGALVMRWRGERRAVAEGRRWRDRLPGAGASS